MRVVEPSGVERTFQRDAMIVSKTDLKGRITYANELFLEVSRFSAEELNGQPHSIIRHPEMPRAVFALLWERLLAGREVFAYVNNLAADGANYWVLAHVTPTHALDGTVVAFHSDRRAANKVAVEAMAPLYRDLLAEEAKYSKKSEVAAAGRALLDERLDERGETYDHFVWGVISGADREDSRR